MKVLYRYEDVHYAGGIEIHLREFYIASETPKGYWISIGQHLFYTPETVEMSKDRWVPKDGTNVYARTTKEAALHDFKCRKIRYKQIMEARLLELETIFDLLKDGEFK